MGWTFVDYTSVEFKTTNQGNMLIDIKATLDRQFPAGSLLRSMLVGSTYFYASIGRNSAVYGGAITTKSNMRATDGFIFGYKDLPIEDFVETCPTGIYTLITAPEQEDFVQKCKTLKAEHRITNPNKLPIGSIIMFKYGRDSKEMYLQLMAPYYQFKTNWWLILDEYLKPTQKYLSKKEIPKTFEIIREGTK